MVAPFPISSNHVIADGIGIQEAYLAVTTGSSTITVTLPPVAGLASTWRVTVRKVDSGVGAVKLVTADSSTIDTVAGATGITTPTTQHAGFTVEPGGGNWWVTGT